MTVLLTSEPLVELLESPRIIDARYGVFFRLHPASIPSMLTGVKGIAILGYIVSRVAAPADAGAASGPDLDAIEPLLASLAQCIVDELRLNRELDEMAEELGARYDELNLLYRAEERAESLDIDSGPDVIEALLRDCASHLSLAAVSLYIPGDDVDFSHLSDPPDDPDVLEGWHRIRDEVREIVRAAGESVVLNDGDRLCERGVEPPSLRLIAAPVLPMHTGGGGILVVMNAPSNPPFNSGDRRIVEALAEQVTSIMQASRDNLTGLLNREGFERRVLDRLESAGDSGASGVQDTLLYIDVDELKIVNDAAGNSAGDELLKLISNLIRGSTRKRDIISRIGDDDFAILLRDCPTEQGTAAAEKLISATREQHFWWQGKLFKPSITIGVVPLAHGDTDVAELLSTGDMACQVAKEHGGNRCHVHADDDHEYANRHGQMQWVPRINQALEMDRFELFSQVIVPLDPTAGHRRHVEILLRMLDDDGRLVPPGAFMPAAERYRLMPDIDRWVIHNTLEIMGAMRDSLDAINLRCAINLSGQSLEDGSLLAFINDEIQRTEVPFERLCFEITETAAVSHFGPRPRVHCCAAGEGQPLRARRLWHRGQLLRLSQEAAGRLSEN